MCINNVLHNTSDVLKIVPEFGDPVCNANLATLKNNPFYGYFGYPRGNGDTKHQGFDYQAEEGVTDILAVGEGEIVRVRFGHTDNEKKDNKCHHKENIKNNIYTFKSDVCSKCMFISGCYGIHVWLKLYNTNNLYALYAHLSKLSETIIGQLHTKTESNTLDIKPIKVKKGELIGKSGRTGIAAEKSKDDSLNVFNGYRWPSHLHFECRKGNGNKIIPNHIVNTKFIIRKRLINEPDCGFIIGKNVWDPLEAITQEQWKEFFKNRNRVLKPGYDPYEIVGEISPRTYITF